MDELLLCTWCGYVCVCVCKLMCGWISSVCSSKLVVLLECVCVCGFVVCHEKGEVFFYHTRTHTHTCTNTYY